jgi:hypothetical protein
MENQAATRTGRKGRLIGMSIGIGVLVGAAAAIVLTVEATVLQPNFEPASLLLSPFLLLPYMMIAGLVIGTIIGLVAGTFAILSARLRRRRTLYVLVFLVCVAVTLVLITLPTTQWYPHLIAHLIVLVISGVMVTFWAGWMFPYPVHKV